MGTAIMRAVSVTAELLESEGDMPGASSTPFSPIGWRVTAEL
jgi:hypothetical protein